MSAIEGLLIVVGFGTLGVWVRMGGHHRLARHIRRWWQARRSARWNRTQRDEV